MFDILTRTGSLPVALSLSIEKSSNAPEIAYRRQEATLAPVIDLATFRQAGPATKARARNFPALYRCPRRSRLS